MDLPFLNQKGENKLLLNQSSHKYEKTASIGTCKCYLFTHRRRKIDNLEGMSHLLKISFDPNSIEKRQRFVVDLAHLQNGELQAGIWPETN